MSGSSVFAVHVYDFANVNIGYSFVSAVAKADDGRLVADVELISDVVEQRGGGGEPFQHIINKKRMHAVLDAFRAASTLNLMSHQEEDAETAEARRQEATRKAAAVFLSKLAKNRDRPPSDSKNTDESHEGISIPAGTADAKDEDD